MTESAQSHAQKIPALLSSDFSEIRRSWDPAENRFFARILPGEFYATNADELIYTTVGSCVAVCIRDVTLGLGGMNHFMLPCPTNNGTDLWESTLVDKSTRYGSFAMERLINTLVGYGAQRQNMEIKMFGGANVISARIDIGERNITFARSYLRAEHLRIQAQDLGGFAARKITYDVKTGEARVKLIADSRKKDLVASRENALIYHVEHTPYEGSIGIFAE